MGFPGLLRWVVSAAGALAFFLTVPSVVTARPQTPSGKLSEREFALRARVNGFYTLLQGSNWSQAEKYVTKDSVDTFRYQQKTPFLDFKIDSIKIEPDGQRAAVLVRVQVMTPYVATPVPMSRPSTWRWVDGEWELQASELPANLLKSEFPQAPTRMPAPRKSPAPELKFENRETIVDPIHPGEVKEVRFPFKNVSDHVVRLTEVKTGSDALRLKGDKKEYKSGESGTLVFEWDPMHYEYAYGLSNSIAITTEPGEVVTLLTARTFVTALPPEKSSPQVKPEN